MREDAREVFRQFGKNLAAFMIDAAPPADTILLGGNIAKAYPLFGSRLPQDWPAKAGFTTSRYQYWVRKPCCWELPLCNKNR